MVSSHTQAILALWQRAHVPRQRKGNARRQAATLRADDRADEVDRRIAEYLARSNSRGAVIDFEGWPTLKHASGIEHDGIAAKQQGLLRFSRRIDDCRGAAAEHFADLTAQFFTQLVVKIHQRLIEQQERRFLDQRAGQRDALLLPSRKLRRQAVQQMIDMHHLRCCSDLGIDLRRGQALRAPQRRRDVFVDSEGGVVHELLIDHRHRPLAHGNSGHVLAVNQNPARGGLIEAGHQPQQRGFAGERGAEQDVHGSSFDGERDFADDALPHRNHVDALKADAHALRAAGRGF